MPFVILFAVIMVIPAYIKLRKANEKISELEKKQTMLLKRVLELEKKLSSINIKIQQEQIGV